MIRLFDIQDGKLTVTEHCYTLKFLKDIMDNYPEDHIKIYTYLFYMTCPNPDLNPFFHFREEEKEEVIFAEIDAAFSTEDELIVRALDLCGKMYETETSRAYYGIKKALDNIGRYMAYTPVTDGRDGNVTQIGRIAKEFDSIRQSYKGVYRDLMEEQQTKTRGGAGLAYDQL